MVEVIAARAKIRTCDILLSSLLKNLAFQAFRYDFLSDRVIAEL
jgi:hypothetical protein